MMGQWWDWRCVSGWRPRWRSAFHGRAPARFAHHADRRLPHCTVAQTRICDCFNLYSYTRMWWLTYTHLGMILSAVGNNYAPTLGSTSGPHGVFSITHSCCLSSVRMLCRCAFAQVYFSRRTLRPAGSRQHSVRTRGTNRQAPRAWARGRIVLLCLPLIAAAATSCGVCFYLSLYVRERPSD